MTGSILQTYLTRNGWRARWIDIAIGMFGVLGQAPFFIIPASLIMFGVLYLRLTHAATPKQGFWIGGRIGFGYFLAGTFWVGSAFIARGPQFIPLMPPMVLGLAALLALFWAIAGRLYVQFMPKTKTVWAVLGFVALFFLAEFTRGHILTGFPWNLPGYIFKAGGAVSQSASVIGVYGLSWIVIFCAVILAISIEKRTITIAFLPAGLCALLFLIGQWRLAQTDTVIVKGPKLRIVQASFDQKDKFDPDKAIGIVNQFLTLTARPGLKDVTHVIWPEGAINGLALENTPLMDAMAHVLLSASDTPPVWLLNTLRHETRTLKDGRIINDYYNSSAAISFDNKGTASLQGYSDKSRLVPFGEYIPGGEWAQTLNIPALSTALASIRPAPSKMTMRFPGLPPVSAQICYEIIFPGFTPKDTPSAEWILNQSNDAWYGRSSGPAQHANQARYRAIEEGLPIIRVASNGWSGLISPYGRFVSYLSPQDNSTLDVQLPKAIETIYQVRINYILFLINLSLCLQCRIVGRRKS